jgi:hypothetical protein
MAYLKAVVMAPTGTPENERIRNWQEKLEDEFDIEMDTATLAQMLPQFDSMLQAGKLDKLQNRMASRGELEIGESQHGVEEGMLDGGDDIDSPVASAILRRILMQRLDLLSKYGPEKVSNAIGDVADFVGDVDEIGSSDVSGWIKQVEMGLGGIDEGIIDKIKDVGQKALDTLGHGSDEDLLRDLKKRAGVRNPENGKPSMAHSDVEKVDEELDADQKRAGQWGPTGGPAKIGNLVGENFINTDDQAVVTEVDTGEYDARKSSSKGETTPEQEKDFRKKVQAYGKELDQRQKEKEKVKEGHDDLAAMLRIINR